MITRRRFVKLVGGAAAVATLPSCGDNVKPTRGLFFDEHQWATIDIATGIILPSDPDGLGARDALAVRYIDGLLVAFERFPDPPQIFAGGPNSGREPYADNRGLPSNTFPPADFRKFLPLSRVQEIAWRARIYGSDTTPLGPMQGWRDLYVDLVVRLDAAAKELDRANPLFVLLHPLDRATALDTVGADFPAYYQTLVDHTLEGTFAAPEYGGNAGLRGWQLAQYKGDSTPLGYAFFDTSSGIYLQRPDEPTSTATPGDTAEDFDPDIINTLTVAAVGSGGKRFF